jgi:hypothetical protein
VSILLGALAIPSASDAAALVPGHLVVVTDLGEIWTVDPTTGEVQPFADLPDPVGGLLAFDGNVLTRNRFSGAVLRVDAASGEVSTVAEGGFFDKSTSYSTGVAFDGTDVLATAYDGSVRVEAGGEQHLAVEGPWFADDVGVEADGSILILLSHAFASNGETHPGGGVVRVDPATGNEVVVTSGGYFEDHSWFTDLEVAADGSIFVLASLFGVVIVDPVTGVQSLPAFPTSTDPGLAFDQANGFALDGTGSYYLAAGHHVFDEVYPGAVVHIVPGGHVSSTTGTSTLYSPLDVAIVPLPEPAAAWHLGVGAAVLAARRRQRRS